MKPPKNEVDFGCIFARFSYDVGAKSPKNSRFARYMPSHVQNSPPVALHAHTVWTRTAAHTYVHAHTHTHVHMLAQTHTSFFEKTFIALTFTRNCSELMRFQVREVFASEASEFFFEVTTPLPIFRRGWVIYPPTTKNTGWVTSKKISLASLAKPSRT